MHFTVLPPPLIHMQQVDGLHQHVCKDCAMYSCFLLIWDDKPNQTSIDNQCSSCPPLRTCLATNCGNHAFKRSSEVNSWRILIERTT
ncbi:unnamed protein product [Heligmosomoides polygyrus]|uniref:Ovule protein n=1 Tax=Heligmosomoides polygyrus TaxID=6339 RepID=A0A183FFI3_HELPZ|nr:unnamed protein product [Heligmosomoides polygyrus]